MQCIRWTGFSAVIHQVLVSNEASSKLIVLHLRIHDEPVGMLQS